MIRIKNIRVCPKENIDIKYLASKKLKVNQYDIKDDSNPNSIQLRFELFIKCLLMLETRKCLLMYMIWM